MKKEDVKKIANNALFDINDEEAIAIGNDITSFDEMIDFLNTIDTTGVKEMNSPDNKEDK